MPALTIAQLRASGQAPAAADRAGFPGDIILEADVDGAKLAIGSTDTLDLFELPPRAGFIVTAAAVTVMRPGTASGVLSVQVGGSNVTGLTAWSTAAAAGTKEIKLATGANTVINTTTASFIRVLQGTAALGTGRYRIRIFGTLLEAPDAQV